MHVQQAAHSLKKHSINGSFVSLSRDPRSPESDLLNGDLSCLSFVPVFKSLGPTFHSGDEKMWFADYLSHTFRKYADRHKSHVTACKPTCDPPHFPGVLGNPAVENNAPSLHRHLPVTLHMAG